MRLLRKEVIMIGNPMSPYWWTPTAVVPVNNQPRVKQIGIFELPTTNVSLSAESVDFGIDKCLYRQLPCECYITLQVNQAVPAGGEGLAVTVVTPTSGSSTNVGSSSSSSGESKTNVIDHNSSNVVGSDLTNTKEVFAFLNKREGIIRFVNFQTGTTAAPTSAGDTSAVANYTGKSK